MKKMNLKVMNISGVLKSIKRSNFRTDSVWFSSGRFPNLPPPDEEGG